MPNFLKKIQLQRLLAFGALIILYVFFAFMGTNFVSMPTTLNILASSYFVGFLAIGVTFVIITGGIDLSIGTVMMCSALVGGELYIVHGLPLWISLIGVVCFGTICGLCNGLLITRMKLPPFIATLGMMMITMGLGSIITGVQSRTYPTIYDTDWWFRPLFIRTEGNFPSGAVHLVIYFAIAIILLNRTKLGRYIYAVGSNEEAVRLSGVKSENWKCMAYVISGFSAGIGAIFYAASYTTMIPGTGNGIELQAIAAVVIGGTSLAGGIGSLTGTVIGVFIMSTLSNGLSSMSLPAPYQTFFTGVVVIGAVLLDIYRTKKANEVKKVKR
jgi:ribose transport system permease protein